VLGETLKIESRARDDQGISQVELRINGVQVDLIDAQKGETSFLAEQSWQPTEVGTYDVAVIAFDNRGQASETALIVVSVLPTATPTPTPQPTPTPTQTPTQAVDCVYNATFVSDVTIPDNTQLAPGTEFVKTWRLRNTGTCDWGTGFAFVFTKGAQMNGPASVSVQPTSKGMTVDVSVSLRAPQEPGTHRGTWRMRTPDGRDFGERPFVQIVVPSPFTPTASPTVPAPKPDLDITLISGNMELLVGQSLALDVTVRNQGAAATDRAALVRAVLRTGLEIEGSIPTLPAGGQATTSLSHTFDEPADLQVFIAVDPDDEIAEEDEENNTEEVTVVVNPSLYATRTITATPGLSFDLDDGTSETDKLDIEWREVEGTVFVGLLNGAGAAPLSGEADSISFTLVAGLNWETEQLALADLAEGVLFGFRTSDGRIGYARVDATLNAARTNARLTYRVWDWP
jgi:PKD repeat protein